MRFLIVGAGDVGTSLAHSLVRDQHDVVLIEKDESHINRLASSLDIELLLGDGCTPETLCKAGLQGADYLIAVTEIDEVNIAACLIAKLLSPKTKRIARLRKIDLDFHDISQERRAEYFDLIINPDQAATDHLLQLFRVPGAKEVVELCNGKLRVLALEIADPSPFAGLPLSQIQGFFPKDPLLVLSIIRDGQLKVPGGQDTLKRSDLVYFLAHPSQTPKLFELSGHELSSGKTAIVWGSGPMAVSLSTGLSQLGVSVKLIVPSEDEGEELLDTCRDALILRGDGKDQELLIDENIDHSDAFFAVTPDEEDNILGSLLAKKLGCRMAVALVNKATYLPLVTAIGVDIVISSRLAAASAIFQHLHSDKFVSEISLRNLGGGFIEIILTNDMPLTAKYVRDIELPKGILFAAVIHSGEVQIPSGDTLLQEGDHLVIFVTNKASSKLEKLVGMKLELFL